MIKPLEITEFDTIVRKSDKYAQDGRYFYLDSDTFGELETFVKEYGVSKEGANAADFFSLGFKKNIGDTITAKNYVGLVQLKNGYQIQILPKIQLGGSKLTSMQIFLRMLRSLKDFQGKIFTNADLKAERMNLYEVFISMYLQETRRLVKHGLKSAYVSQEDNLNYCKGKILIPQHVKYNHSHKEKFYCAYDEYQINRAENKLVKSTLLKLKKLTESATNAKEINQLLAHFELVDVSLNYEKDFSKVVIDRNTKDYDLLMRWSKVFLYNKSFSTFSGTVTSRTLLFPMEKLFESYVAREMRKAVSNDWRVSTQDRGYYLFDTPQPVFSLRPDIVVQIPNCPTVILDTKWKRLIPNPSKNYGISQEDMYQMYAYSKKYKTSEIWLLYPYDSSMDEYKNVLFRSLEENQITNVHVFMVDLANMEDSMGDLIEKIIENTSQHNVLSKYEIVSELSEQR